jgi:CDP-diacylglycerol--glycerol-3-phosphate 3-phosphatidyltransferase
MPLSLANKITFLRLFCIPFFVLLLLYYDRTVRHGVINDGLRISASILFFVTFVSDAIDGYIARTRNQITRLGTILDPLVDKTLLLSALILLTYASKQAYEMYLPIWFVWLVICRDIMLVAGALLVYFINGMVKVRPRISGKITTFFQMTLIIWVLLNLPGQMFPFLLWSAAIFTGISAIQYFFDGIRQFA